jgi:UDP-N-acetylmuramate dehydrogenase
MNNPEPRRHGLVERLPDVRGRYRENADLARSTWFGVGGPVEVMFRPTDAEDLARFLAATPAEVPVTVVGVGSNLLVRDGGVPGVVVRLGRGFARVATLGNEVHAGAAALDGNVAVAARDAGLSGLEFLSGIPGTIGGALRMNAGAWGGEMKDVTVAARAVDRDGTGHYLELEELGFAYRHTAVPEDWIFTATVLAGTLGDAAAIAARMDQIRAHRDASQPLRRRSGGSTFINPPGTSAWELIERAGCRGLRRGGAQVSEKHCNFLLNTGEATAADLEGLGEEVRRRVREATGVTLEWEIRRIGVAAPGTVEEVRP